jgi:hypothetical protein
MPSNTQYTVRGIPAEVDAALRRRARQRGVSLNQLLVEELTAAGRSRPQRHRRLSDLPGRWQNDPQFDRILAEQRVIGEGSHRAGVP